MADDHPDGTTRGTTRRAVLAGSAGLLVGGLGTTGTAGAARTTATGTATPTAPEPAWTATVDRPGAIRRMRAQGGLLLAEYPEELVAYSRENGSRRWSYAPGARQYATTPHKETAYVRRFGTVTAVGSEGDRQWRHEHGDATVSTVVGGTRVFAGDDDTMVGLASDGGAEEWRVEQGATRPVATDGGVVAAHETVADGPDRFAGIEAGEEAWSYEPQSPVAAVDHGGGSLFVGLEDRVVALALADGTVEWELETGRTAAESTVRSGGLTVVGAGGRAIGVDHASGEVRWVNPIASTLRVVAGTGSVTIAISGEPAVYVLDGNGAVVRDARLGEVTDLVFSRPGDTAGGHAYVAAAGIVTALGPDGAEQWSQSIGGAANSLGVDRGGLFALDGDTLYRFPAAIGNPAGTVPGDDAGFALGDAPVLLALAAGVLGGGSALAYYLRRNRD